jgi:tryptophanyl-tRNA synthetase
MSIDLKTKKTIFSGMQPTGSPTIGNYLGAIKHWNALQDEYNCLYSVVDMHAITVKQDPSTLRQMSRNLVILYIATGLDPKKNIIYYQSQVSAHAELAWILNCFSYMGELSRMTQFKEKSLKHKENINVGLFTYPVLMASDILLFGSDLVPTGEDQKQHLELCRDIAARFNALYGEVFKIPEPYIAKNGARIMSLQEPTKKMSKSSQDAGTIFLLDEPNVILNKVKKSVTDSDNTIIFSSEKPGVSNLITIYCSILGKTICEAEANFKGVGYGSFKAAVAESIIEELKPIKQKFTHLSSDKTYIDSIMKDNAVKANDIAIKTLNKVKRKIGYQI